MLGQALPMKCVHVYLYVTILFLVMNTWILLFTGTAEITIKCIQRTNKILLHSKELNWTKVELRNHKQKKINVIQIDTLSDVEMVEIKTEKPLKVNKTYQLSIEFTGKITDILQGFYYSPYKENNSTK